MDLKTALKKVKMSQTELAKALFVKPQQVSLWVNGKYAPHPETQRKIDKILGVCVEYYKDATQ